MKRFYLLAAAVFLYLSATAQISGNLPIDPKIKSGRLDNGLTYFIMKNTEPQGQAEFFIVQKAGSVLEEDNQRGLAHFLEHMAFNGTENFPDNELISYLQKIGVRFGENLNAYTSTDETVYNISSVPVKREGIIDSCLLILRDWACAITLNDTDIDKERGIIREEIRTRNVATMRMYEKILPEIMPGSRYVDRLPAGSAEIIDTFSYEELRNYYHKWYRPDLQGIIVVGDIDPETVEVKLRNLFGSIPKPVDPAIREEFEVPNNKAPLASVVTDPESALNYLMLIYKQDVFPKEHRGSPAWIVFDFMKDMVIHMLNSRLNEIVEHPDAPFTSLASAYGDFLVSNTKSMFGLYADAKDEEPEKAFRSIVIEAEKVKRHGFTASEYERAKASYLSRLETLYKERDKQRNSYYTGSITTHFLTGNAMPGIEMEFTMLQRIIPIITLDELNKFAQSLITEENVVIIAMLREKEGQDVLSAEQLISIYENARLETIKPYEESLSGEPLVAQPPKAGTIVSKTIEPVSKAVVWNLSNGATVVVKETDFREDQIIMSAVSKGGSSLFDRADIVATKVVDDIVSIGGLGNFNTVNLQKVLAGKNAFAMPHISVNTEMVNGNCSPKDLETLMQLIYLNFTSLRKDEDAFESYLNHMKAQLSNMEADPMTSFADTLRAVLYNNNEYAERPTLDILDKIDYDRILELASARFANAADFVFIFVGNIDMAELEQLTKTYIASLPGNKENLETSRDIGLYPVRGKVKKHFDKQMQSPKTTIYSINTGSIPFNIENLLMAEMTKQIFDMVFTKSIREEEQGTYGVSVSMGIDYYPHDSFEFMFGFDTDISLKEKLLSRIYQEIRKIVDNGINKEDFNNSLEFMNKQYQQNLRENKYWLNILKNRYLIGKDLHTERKTLQEIMTVDKLNAFIREVFNSGNHAEIVMTGKPL